MTQHTQQDRGRYRFVTADGRSTPWRNVPKHGIGGVQYTRARRDLGPKFNLELLRAYGEDGDRS